jgi:hypothetical protein
MAGHAPTSAAGANKDALDELADDLAKEGLAHLLADADIAQHAVDWIVDQFGTRKVFARLAVRLIAMLATAAAEKSGEWLSDVARQHLKTLLLRLPFAKALLEKGKTFIGYLDKEVRAKNEVKKMLAGGLRPRDLQHTEELKQETRLGLAALVKLHELADQLAALEDLISPQPLLDLPLFDEGTGGLNRFFFGTQKIPLVGRDADLAALDEFLGGPAPFAWWLVAGPGGLGKSRLALELCLRHGMVWRAGFLPSDYTAYDFRTWKPSQPTLIVVDYVMSRAKAIGELIRTLYLRRNELLFPVRVLLLERDTEGDWLDRLHGRRGRDRAALLTARHAEPHVLKPLSSEDLWKTIAFMLDDVGQPHPDKAATMSLLRSIDPEGRPLFAALLADALAAGVRPPHWNRQVLVEQVLEREEANWWEPAGVSDQDKNLLALATLSGGLNRGDRHPPAIAERLASFSPQRYRTMIGEDAAERLAPLQPDIVGELFVLERLSPANAADALVDAFRDAAWNEKQGTGIADFLYRAASDFAPHEALPRLAKPATETSAERESWALTATDLVSVLGAPDIDGAKQVHADLVALADTHPEERMLRLEQAKASYNLINALCRRNDLKDAMVVYRGLSDFAGRHVGDSALAERRAKAVVNLISCCDAWGETTVAQQLFDEASALAARYGDEPTFRVRQAEAAHNLINAYAHQESEKAAEIYKALVRLADGHPAESQLRIMQAGALGNRLARALNSGDLQDARRTHDELAVLAKRHGKLATVAKTAGEAAIRVLMAYGEAGETDKAREIYDELKAAAATEGTAAARSLHGNAGFNLVSIYGRTGDSAGAQSIFQEISALASQHPMERGLRWDRSVAGFNLLSAHHRAGELGPQQKTYEELATFAAAHPDELQLCELQARAAILLASSYGQAGDLEKACGLLDAITTLSQALPHEPMLRQHQATIAFNLINALWQKDARTEATAMYERLGALVRSFPEEGELRQVQASGALNLVYRQGAAGKLNEARRLQSELLALCRQHKSETKLLEAGLQASVYLRDLYERAGNADAAEISRDIETLSAAVEMTLVG